MSKSSSVRRVSFSSHDSSFGSIPFEPDLGALSAFPTSRKSQLIGGERKLMAAILSDGIESYITHCSSLSFLHSGKGEAANEAWQWVHTKDFSYVFSFDNVCESLGIDPDYLRLGLSRYLDAVKKSRREGKVLKWQKLRRPRKK